MSSVQRLTRISSFRHRVAKFKARLSYDCFQSRLIESLTVGASFWTGSTQFGQCSEEKPGPKVLLVVAHPDDESECAAILYRITHEMGGIVDQLIVTDGEGGHRYSAPADAYYGLPIGETASRRHLVRVRRQEVLRAGRILGFRSHYFLNERDTGLTWDPHEGFNTWNIERTRRELLARLQSENYDLVFMLLPAPGTHGHHQTVAVLTLEAISRLKADRRPAALGVQTVAAGATHAGVFEGLENFPLTRTTHAEPVWEFDRRTPMRCHRALEYSIVANWVIAEHKSQGMFQMECGRRTHEAFWLFDVCGSAGAARWDRFLHMLEAESNSSETHREVRNSSNTAEPSRHPAAV